MQLILASASPARRAVLRAAGVSPVTIVSGVDEESLAASLVDPAPADLVLALARAKADAVAATQEVADRYPDAVVIGCDSMLHTVSGDGSSQMVGKPDSVQAARSRWAAMAGGEGALLTGHSVLRIRQGRTVATAAASASTIVRFSRPSTAELEAYLATGEPLAVAGAFTLDGLGGWFIDGIDGDPSSVIGISLPLTRTLLGEVGISVTELWER
ncbi:MAG: Maf family protein [Sciscionella sp.]